MNIIRSRRKKRECRQHRETWYERSLDKLMNGTAKPGDVTYRWNKLKAVR